MATKWRDDEVTVISVTPLAEGVVAPLLALVTAIVLVVEGAAHVHVLRVIEGWLALVVVVPIALVALTRTWRWRSHKVHVTSQRVLLEGGALHHWRSSIELRDVFATRVEQRVSERLARRGVVVLETRLGPVLVGRVRHPGALCRMIDAERSHDHESLPLDTVFTFEEPDRSHFRVRLQPPWQDQDE